MALEARGADPRTRADARTWRRSSSSSIAMRYHSNISVAENLLFGTPRQPGVPAGEPADQPRVRRAAARRRAARRPLRGGRQSGAASWSSCSPTSRPTARSVRPVQLHQRRRSARIPDAAGEDRRRHARRRPPTKRRRGLLALTFRLVAAQHRLGVIDESRMQTTMVARSRARRVPPPLRGARRRRRFLRARPLQLDAFDPGQHPVRAGRASSRRMRRRGSTALVREVAAEVGMERRARCGSGSSTKSATADRGFPTRSGSASPSPAAS